MAVPPEYVKKEKEKHVLEMSADETLQDAQNKLQEQKYPPEDTYVVLKLSGNYYRAAHIFAVQQAALQVDWPTFFDEVGDRPDLDLRQVILQLKLSTVLTPVETQVASMATESITWIEEWLDNHRDEPLVVVDGQGKYAGLLISGGMPGGSRGGLCIICG